jgi:hypothetical protein
LEITQMRKTFIYNGCTVTAFRAADDGILPAGEWCLRIGGNVYSGFKTRKAAIAGVSRFI